MVRGVNRQIIEVVDTGSQEFERAILFVHPDSQRLGPDRLAQSAKQCLGRLRLGSGVAKRKRSWRLLGLLAAFGLGLAAGLLLFPLL